MEAYRKWAENGAAIFREYGCIEIVDSWEDNVPVGKYTDFRRAVDAKDGEKIVFSWQVWPDKATLDSAEAKMHEDGRLEVSGDIPFDSKRLRESAPKHKRTQALQRSLAAGIRLRLSKRRRNLRS